MHAADRLFVNLFSLLSGNIKKFQFDDETKKNHKIPHMGWNYLTFDKELPYVFSHLSSTYPVYFVHSYYANPKSNDNTYAYTDHGITFPAIIQKDNYLAAQFHPEKSGQIGLECFKRFCQWDPSC